MTNNIERERNIAANIIQYAKAHGITQRKLAEIMNLPSSTVAQKGIGRVRLYVGDLLNFCDALGIDPREAITSTGKEEEVHPKIVVIQGVTYVQADSNQKGEE